MKIRGVHKIFCDAPNAKHHFFNLGSRQTPKSAKGQDILNLKNHLYGNWRCTTKNCRKEKGISV